MPTFTPEDEKQNDALNPGQQDYDQRFNDIRNAEEKAAFDNIAGNYASSTADSTTEDANIKRLKEKEAEGLGASTWENKTTPQAEKKKVNWKKRGPLLGIGGGLGIMAFVFSGFIGPSMMLPSMSNMAFAKNDSRGTMLERRLAKVLDAKMSKNTSPCSSTKIACRKNMMPKSMLSAMEKKGITPLESISLDADGNKVSGKKLSVSGNGYVDKNPAGYEFTDKDGKLKIISANDFKAEYKNNPAFRKMFKSAYNMRFLGYNGRYMLKNFFKKFGLNRDGGQAAKGDLNESNAKEKLDEKTKPIATADDIDGAKSSIRDRLKLLLDRTSKKTAKSGGDPILLAGAVGCAAINLPTFIAGTYRALQVAQVISLASDVVMSPAGMQQAGAAKAESISAIGNLLTERPKNPDGTLGKSALDSQILQSAMGVNKNKVTLSKYAPGYSLITNGAVQGFGKLSKSSKTTCNLILSPQAAVAVTGVETAISVGSAGIGAAVILGLKAAGRVMLAIGAMDAGMKLAEESGALDFITEKGYDIVKSGLGNYVEGAHGEELGDALGVGMYSFFSQAGLAGGGAVLKTSQVDDYSAVMASVDNEYREEDIATLSPFDISSQYTFMGSIVSRLSLSSVQGNPVASSLSMLGSIISSPLSLLTKNSSADISMSESTCSYGDAIGMEDDIAINPAGYPCVGIPVQYLDMSRDEVYNLVADQIDEETGEPKDDSDISLMMSDCSDGDLESLSGCTIDAVAPQSSSHTYCSRDSNGNQTGDCETYTFSDAGVDSKKRAAESLYMFDQQIENMLSGEDSEQAIPSDDASGAVTNDSTETTSQAGGTSSFISLLSSVLLWRNIAQPLGIPLGFGVFHG